MKRLDDPDAGHPAGPTPAEQPLSWPVAGEGLRVLLVQAHPRADSFCAALADAYAEGASEAGVPVQRVALGELEFDPDVWLARPKDMAMEPDLQRVCRLIEQCDHMVFVYPTWWGTMPARLKGLFDRILTGGWAFQFHADHLHWDQLLAGRTVELITTMDTPPLLHRLFNRRPGYNAMRRATLGFCGVTTVRETVCGSIITSSPAQRQRWLTRVRNHGRRLTTGGPWRRHQRWGRCLRTWLASMRLQFYPMSWAAYTIGALAAPRLATSTYWLGYVVLFLLEVATVWINDVQDYESDRRNRYFSPFNGGSRVLVTGALQARQLNRAVLLALVLLLVGAGVLLARVPQPLAAGGLLVGLSVLALGYTLPPLKLVYRGFGELNVAVTHSIGVLLCGFVFQGGGWQEGMPWLLSLPLGLSVFAGILLGNIPDIEADRATGKRTLPVQLGPAGVTWLALAAVLAAAAAGWWVLARGHAPYGWTLIPMTVYALVLMWRLAVYARRKPEAGRIDLLLIGTMTFVLWFCVPPLFYL